MPGLGIGISPCFSHIGAVLKLLPETLAYKTRVEAEGGTVTKLAVVNAIIKTVKDYGFWDLLDEFALFGVTDAAGSLIKIKYLTEPKCAKVSTPDYDATKGYHAVSGKAINTKLNMLTAAYDKQNFSFGAFINNDVNNTADTFVWGAAEADNSNNYLAYRNCAAGDKWNRRAFMFNYQSSGWLSNEEQKLGDNHHYGVGCVDLNTDGASVVSNIDFNYAGFSYVLRNNGDTVKLGNFPNLDMYLGGINANGTLGSTTSLNGYISGYYAAGKSGRALKPNEVSVLVELVDELTGYSNLSYLTPYSHVCFDFKNNIGFNGELTHLEMKVGTGYASMGFSIDFPFQYNRLHDKTKVTRDATVEKINGVYWMAITTIPHPWLSVVDNCNTFELAWSDNLVKWNFAGKFKLFTESNKYTASPRWFVDSDNKVYLTLFYTSNANWVTSTGVISNPKFAIVEVTNLENKAPVLSPSTDLTGAYLTANCLTTGYNPQIFKKDGLYHLQSSNNNFKMAICTSANLTSGYDTGWFCDITSGTYHNEGYWIVWDTSISKWRVLYDALSTYYTRTSDDLITWSAAVEVTAIQPAGAHVNRQAGWVLK